MLDSGSASGIGLAVVVLGGALVVGGMVGASHGSRSRYRPDRWLVAEWLVVATGLLAVAGVVICGRGDPGSLTQPLYPLGLPAVPTTALVCILGSVLASALSPTLAGQRPKLKETLA